MSMPKKGRRTIVVDNETYYYKVRSQTDCWGTDLIVVFETPGGKIHSNKFFRDSKYTPFTPAHVAELIRETMGK